ncbi:MAG: lytic transglycosylase domain-containing protein [Acidobacteria bacterium]|nr:lytic transglycosylase domain-containing protein [Acidobacteriota bacterium]MBU1339037.1 lytic transglycosylase domain-containing protein [Acidobacteriota bacterium]MBU4255156.1 lytic transglycosylase domain-containing protein [Acidobacteriota bacterium]MBU4330822.1 lytic transglycosylase domain-containing protein [Acidobacteriota bacterium]MBU4496173.1 lytic transglycosylase domain-containing protein [Acidobacteriota bacterium]
MKFPNNHVILTIMRNFGVLRRFAVLTVLFFITALWVCSAPSSPEKYDELIQTLSQKHGIHPQLIHAVISAESNYDPGAVSSKGAKGLMQLMPETAKDYGVDDIYDPQQNIEAGIKHLKFLLNKYETDLNLALAAYNAGQQAVDKYDSIPPYPETRTYVNKINRSLAGRGVLDAARRTRNIYTYTNTEGRLVITNIPHLQKRDIREKIKGN